jgi:EmrB/QacA subfamily drug resistance transporter
VRHEEPVHKDPRSSEEPPALSPGQRWPVVAMSTTGAFMAPFLGSIVAVALPDMGSDLDLGFVGGLWVQAAYLLTFAVALIPAGRSADAWGALRIYRIGAVVFAVTSAVAGTAASAGWMIAARVGQGLGAALLSATSVVLVTRAFPRQERGRALGINVTAVYLGLALGPVIGGVLTERTDWRLIFFLPLPVALATLAFGMRLREQSQARRARVDVPGTVLLAVALGSGMTGLIMGPVWGWTAVRTVALLTAGVAGLAAFVAVERARPDPLVDVRTLLRNPVFAASNLAALLNYTAIFGVFALTSVFLQVSGGRSPEMTGFVLAAQPFVMVALAGLAGRLSDKVGHRSLATAGMLVISAGMFLLSRLSADTQLWWVVAPLGLIGVGVAAFSAPNTSAVMGSVTRSQYGVAAATVGTMRVLGQSLSVAILGAIATSRLGPEGQSILFEHGSSLSAASDYAAGYRSAMQAGAGIALAGAVAAFLSRPRTGTLGGRRQGRLG